MKVSAVTVEWSMSAQTPGWVVKFAGGSFDGVPLTPPPEWQDAGLDLEEDEIRDMVQATAAWEGIPVDGEFRLNVVK